MTLPTFQFFLNGLSDQVRSFLAVLKNGVYTVEGPGRESSGGLFVIYAFSSHAHENR